MVEEAFMEQKDVLLEMLELKLKEVRDKKKKKSNGKLDHAGNTDPGCDAARSAELKMTANGISAVGEVEGRLSFGRSGKSNLKLIASGISNIGRSNLDLAVDNGNFNVPGFNNLFLGTNCVKHILGALGKTHKNPETESRRIVPGILKHDNVTENLAYTETKANVTKTQAKDTKILPKVNVTQAEKFKATETKSNATKIETIVPETVVTNHTVVNTEATTVKAAIVTNGPAAS